MCPFPAEILTLEHHQSLVIAAVISFQTAGPSVGTFTNNTRMGVGSFGIESESRLHPVPCSFLRS